MSNKYVGIQQMALSYLAIKIDDKDVDKFITSLWVLYAYNGKSTYTISQSIKDNIPAGDHFKSISYNDFVESINTLIEHGAIHVTGERIDYNTILIINPFITSDFNPFNIASNILFENYEISKISQPQFYK